MGHVPPKADELARIGLFGAVEKHAVEFLCERTECKTLPPGRVVFEEGTHGAALFVILNGTVEVLKRDEVGGERPVAVLGAGKWFGDMSLIDLQPRSATVRTRSVVSLLQIHAADLEALYRYDMRAYCVLTLNLARELSRRLRESDPDFNR